MNARYDRLADALRLLNRDQTSVEAQEEFHAAVLGITRSRKHKLHRSADFDDFCQVVELAIVEQINIKHRMVEDVVRQVSTIVDHKIGDINGRSKISRATQTVDDDEWERIEAQRPGDEIGFDAVVITYDLADALESVKQVSKKQFVALEAARDGRDVHAALAERFGPMDRNVSKQILHRARARLKAIMKGKGS